MRCWGPRGSGKQRGSRGGRSKSRGGDVGVLGLSPGVLGPGGVVRVLGIKPGWVTGINRSSR